MRSVFDFAAEFGRDLRSTWDTADGLLDAFPDASLATIEAFRPEREISLTEVTESVLAHGARLPRQRNSGTGFGQPPLTLYNDPDNRFFLELYLWSCVDMTIHDHQFTGAFVVLSGACRNDVFEFGVESSLTDLQFGAVSQVGSEQLGPGSARAITNGRSFIHRNLHLGRPTLTLVVRTLRDGVPGFIYDERGLAHDPGSTAPHQKQLDFLAGLLRFDTAAARSYLTRLVTGEKSATLAYYAMELYARATRGTDELERLLPVLAERFGPEASRLQEFLRVKHLVGQDTVPGAQE
ncbi:hypothetical protein [Streptomyces venezuelae]|uniref:hypothetical protein n=1 Tax=Streptomyces venezuelae TaxID=54571 RepID=UPI0037B9E3A0